MLRLSPVIVMGMHCEVCGGASEEGLHSFALRRDQVLPCPTCARGMRTICTTAEARSLIFCCPQGHQHLGPLTPRDEAPQLVAAVARR